jgi:hypothetical protein
MEEHATAESAIKREKAIKPWSRRWTIQIGSISIVSSLGRRNRMDARVKPGHDEGWLVRQT